MPLQRQTSRPTVHSDLETVPWQVDACPACGDDLVNGQGLLGCVDCDWSGLVA